jgi:hypothetical protein
MKVEGCEVLIVATTLAASTGTKLKPDSKRLLPPSIPSFVVGVGLIWIVPAPLSTTLTVFISVFCVLTTFNFAMVFRIAAIPFSSVNTYAGPADSALWKSRVLPAAVAQHTILISQAVVWRKLREALEPFSAVRIAISTGTSRFVP